MGGRRNSEPRRLADGTLESIFLCHCGKTISAARMNEHVCQIGVTPIQAKFGTIIYPDDDKKDGGSASGSNDKSGGK